MDITTIKPGIGVGDIRLNCVPGDIIDLLGEPESKDAGTDSDMWYYSSLNLSVMFEKQENAEWRLIEIDASDPAIRINNIAIYDVPRDEAEELLAKAGLRNGRWVGDSLTFHKERLSFGFFDGLLEEVMVLTP
ncbi:MAG TPA: hypothetical protein VII32_13555 [Thermoanaerobaculia bacterium]